MMRVKHLNPRQGITTPPSPHTSRLCYQPQCETPKSPPGDYNDHSYWWMRTPPAVRCVKHLNPRQGITTRPDAGSLFPSSFFLRVKHLNPRQGITTLIVSVSYIAPLPVPRVKHLNPRQGITTHFPSGGYINDLLWCETPKSPPGDYNISRV